AYIQLQNFAVQRQQIANDLQSARLTLLTFLWNEESQVAQEVGKTPTDINAARLKLVDSLQFSQDDLIQRHPELRSYDIKVQKLAIDNRMKREKLKPKLNLEYNLLQTPATGFSEIRGLDNYNWGVSFSFPIFLREQRGELRMSTIKLENTNYEFQQKRQSILNKARQYEYSFENIGQQLMTYTTVVDQYEMLLKAELRKFEIGESSIFLINYRQISLVNAELKLIELKTKYRMYYRQWLHSLGASTEIWLAE
ncbi:MAG: outer membrane protein TolC, partial [Marivirga sp.]